MSELQMKQIKTPEQIKEMCFLASRIWREHYGQILSADQITYMVEKFQSFKAVTNQIEHQGYTYCWLVCDGQNAGFCGYKIENGALFLSKLYIEKTFRRKGLASFALEELKKICREKSLGYIWLTVNRDNLGSVAFYRQAGFYVDHDEVTDIGHLVRLISQQARQAEAVPFFRLPASLDCVLQTNGQPAAAAG